MQGVYRRKVFQDLPELVEQLREQKAKTRDLVAPLSRMWMAEKDENGKLVPVMAIGAKSGMEALPLIDWAHGQVASKTKIPVIYYRRCQREDPELLSINVNKWLQQIRDDHPKDKPEIKMLIRILNDKIRAVLSNKYRIIDHLDLVTTAVQVVTGQNGEQEHEHARGAKCFVWHLNPVKLDVGFVNPAMAVDLNDIEAGVQGRDLDRTAMGYTGGDHNWVKPAQDRGTQFVFPAAFIKNNEGGGGSAIVEVGLYEAICDNTCRIGTNMVKRHLGKTIVGSEVDSPETRRKQNELVFSQFADTLRQAFDPEKLLALCRRLKNLEKTEVEDVKESVTHLVKHHGLTEALRDDILSAYAPANPGRHTMLDVQRAVTNAAHKVREDSYEAAETLEQVGGKLIAATK
jgi:hypothetical protein